MAINFVPLWNLYKSRLIDDFENSNELTVLIYLDFISLFYLMDFVFVPRVTLLISRAHSKYFTELRMKTKINIYIYIYIYI